MFHERLKARRKAIGFTQQDLGQKIGAGISTISEWESGKRSPDIERLPIIAQALRTSPGYLMGWTIDPTGPIATDGETPNAPHNAGWAAALLDAYEAASPDIQRAACAVLGLPRVVPFDIQGISATDLELAAEQLARIALGLNQSCPLY